MILRKFVSAAAAAAVLTASVLPAAARPVTPAEKRYAPYTGIVPPCDDGAVLATIKDHFQDKEATYWKSELEVVDFDRIRQTGLRSWGMDHIPRRYCEARVLLNDRRWRHVTYWIGEGVAFAGWNFGVSFGVEFCVSGLDRNWAYAPNCKMARP